MIGGKHGSGHDRAAMHSYGLAWGVPFAGLLLTIALAPLAAPAFWHRHYAKLVLLWPAGFLVADAVEQGAAAMLQDAAGLFILDYLPFVLLLGALFAIAGGIKVSGIPRGTPGVNTMLLGLGTLLASVIGTTGASMVMLRPLIAANRQRRRPVHVFVFFIFLVANIGGALTPLGNPPILLGFLSGVPFFWPAAHLAAPAATLAAALLAVFYVLDYLIHRRAGPGEPGTIEEIEKLGVEGGINLVLLLAAVAAVLLRALWQNAPAVAVLGVDWNLADIVADLAFLGVGVLSLLLTRPATRRANEFAWEPMAEVAIVFAAIFITLVPVMAMIAAGTDGPVAPLMARLVVDGNPVPAAFYWGTGALSALLDNAPTYLVFFGFAGDDAKLLTGSLAHVLTAISAGAVFFGGMTYIGNAPNFMIKAIVERHDIKMPSFFGFAGWATLFLLPWLAVIGWIFFR
jgi:Na+/H+ antiporter NhaD/arsenite permease-like protein